MKKIDTFGYKGWLISDSFVKRSFASLGYHFMGGLFVWVGLFAIGLAIMALGAILKMIF
jgi:hypothetical protein